MSRDKEACISPQEGVKKVLCSTTHNVRPPVLKGLYKVCVGEQYLMHIMKVPSNHQGLTKVTEEARV